MEQGKISPLQLAMMMYPAILATAYLLVPSITSKYAGRDMWLSPMISSVTGFLAVYLAYWFNKRYPGQSMIQFSERIVGKIGSKVVGAIYFFYLLQFTGVIIREYGEFVASTFLRETPMFVTMGLMVLACAVAVRGGVEVLARCALVFMPIVILFFFLVSLMTLPDAKPRNMLPVMEFGVQPALVGAVVPAGWFSEFFLTTFLFPFVTDPGKGMKWGMISVAAVMLMLTFANLTTLLLFGPITEGTTFPVMTAVRYISIADFIQHVESVITATWLLGMFVKNAVFNYALVLATAQWLKLSDYRPIVFPIGLLLLLMSFWSAPNLQGLAHFIITVPFYLISVHFVVPLILLLIAVLRRKRDGIDESAS